MTRNGKTDGAKMPRRMAKPPHPSAPDTEATVTALESMNLDRLRQEWRSRYSSDPPVKQSADMLRRFLAWRIQEEAYGGLSAVTKRRLHSLAAAFAADPKHQPFLNVRFRAGTVLTREWNGVVHKVDANDTGYVYQGRHFGSLSEIARRITGTRWSGPAFFGLRKAGRALPE